MTILFTLIIFILSLGLIYGCSWIWSMRKLDRDGRFTDTEPTLFDVKDLVHKGENDLAVLLYCKIFKCGFRQGEKAVKELARSINHLND